MIRKVHRVLRPKYFVIYFFCFFLNCATTSKIPNLSDLTPRDIQLKTAQNFYNLKSFEGKARVIIEVPGRGHRGYSSVYIKLPDSVYVKTEATLGIDVGDLFLDKRFFAAYAPRDNILYYGEVETLDLKDFLEVEIETEELFEIFTGLNQIVINDTSKLTFSGGQFVITTQLDRQTLVYWVDSEKYVVTKSQTLDKALEIVLLKEYKRLRKRKGLILPQIIKLTRPKARERITVYYTSQKVNKRIPKQKFRIKPARNAKRVYWGNAGRSQKERDLQKKTNHHIN